MRGSGRDAGRFRTDETFQHYLDGHCDQTGTSGKGESAGFADDLGQARVSSAVIIARWLLSQWAAMPIMLPYK